jgi:uncharacterized repeat protein (TIGR02543 family)
MNTVLLVLGIVLVVVDILAIIKTRNDFLDERSKRNKVKFITAIGALPVALVLAFWLPQQGVERYAVSFDANGGSGTVPAAQTVRAGNSVTLPGGSWLTRSGYTFGGWTNANGSVNFSAGSSFMPSGNITLYARWEAIIIYTVTYSANGGSGTPPGAQTVQAGYSVTLPGGSGLTRSSYTFGGWNTIAVGTGTNRAAGTSFTPTGDITLYAKWDPVIVNYTVTYSANNGSGTPPGTQTVRAGYSVTLPGGSGLTRSGYTFDGWINANGTSNYSVGSSFTPTGNITLYAKWIPSTTASTNNTSGGGSGNTGIPSSGDITVPGSNLAAKLDWLQTNAQSNRNHIVDVAANENISRTLEYSGKSNVTVTLRGSGANRTIALPSNGNIFSVHQGVTLVLDNNITLQGRNNNGDYPLIYVDAGGSFMMNNGSFITGNSSGASGGVYIRAGATFTMNGGTISGNTAASNGGGVDVNGAFTMNGGTISGNNAAWGGGVNVGPEGTFTMRGGTISGNTAANRGGGVDVDGRLNMSGGTISGNTANFGGGVGVNVEGTFTKTGGTITGTGTNNGNVARTANSGHAVYANNSIRRETTAESAVSMSYNGRVNPPTSSGAWTPQVNY